jgi:UDP-GlcNAc:undecaprenyl-phosphate GlcNAc-1-phosphate transferase
MGGLATGLGGLAAAFFMLVAIGSQQALLSLFSTILLGACLGSYYFNSSPARFFLGDSGAQFLGFTLGALGIAYNPLGFSRLASWFIPILLLGVPIFDTTLVVYSRLRRRQPVYQAARDHTYHRLVAMGVSSSRAVLTMHGIGLLLGCAAFIALNLSPLIATGTFALVLLLGAAAVIFLERQYKTALPSAQPAPLTELVANQAPGQVSAPVTGEDIENVPQPAQGQARGRRPE